MRRNLRQRLILLRLAYDCKTVSITRSEVIRASVVIQRAWKTYLRKRKLLTSSFVRFQISEKEVFEDQVADARDGCTDIWIS